jgi:hypothetical protein
VVVVVVRKMCANNREVLAVCFCRNCSWLVEQEDVLSFFTR